MDISAPKIETHNSLWKKCDILDRNSLLKCLKQFAPTTIVHLAARTDTLGDKIEEYNVNYDGTLNIVQCGNKISSVKQVIITSTQFVHQYHGLPKDDDDYAPHTVYGESKVRAEKCVKNGKWRFAWTIIRPTNIWGPWHPRYPFEFWKTMGSGLYFHPGNEKVIRAYGYVGNVVWQIMRILELQDNDVNQKVFYVGDQPLNLLEWVNAFSLLQRGRKVKVIPRRLVKAIALLGDLFSMIAVPFPLTSSRFKSMTTNNQAPMGKTFEVLGNPPYSLHDGVLETIKWIEKYHPRLIKKTKKEMAF